MYAICKTNARQMGRLLCSHFEMNFIEITISNVYGEGEISNRLISSTLIKLLRDKKAEFTEASQLYDFMYIDDAIEAIYLVGMRGYSDVNYYIGNKNQRPLREFIEEIKKCIDENVILDFGKIPFYGVSLQYNEFYKYALYKEFDFQPKVSFKEGIKRTVEWMKNNL